MAKPKPIKVLSFDWHLKPNTIETVKGCASQVLELCQKHKCGLVIGGDWYTSREAQPLTPLIESKRIFGTWKEAGLDVLAIAGNHDKVSLNSEDSYLDMSSSDLFLVKAVYFEDIGKVRIHYLPYFKESGKYGEYLKKAVKNIDQKKINVLVTHVAVNGVRNNDGTVVESGLEVKLFSKFHKVYVGHYHDRQLFDNIEYCGSVYQNNFGEDQEKGVAILMDDGSVGYHNLGFPKFYNIKPDISKCKTAESAFIKIEKEYNSVKVETQDRKIVSFKVPEDWKETISTLAQKSKIDKSSIRISTTTETTESEVDVSEISTMNIETIKKEFPTFISQKSTSKTVVNRSTGYIDSL